MICAQRLLRRARATDEEEMMEIHLENQMGKDKQKKSASNAGNSMDYNSRGLKCRVFFKSGQFLFLHLFVKKTMMSLNHSSVNR